MYGLERSTTERNLNLNILGLESTQEILKTILKKEPFERNSSEITFLLNQTKEIQFFIDYVERGEKDIHINCCRSMKYLTLTKGEKVFEIDTIGTTFYIILSGVVGVYVRSTSEKEDHSTGENQNELAQNTVQKPEGDEPTNNVIRRGGKKKTTVHVKKSMIMLPPEDPTPVNPMTQVKTMSTGLAFGELALLSNKPRAATISCLTDCEFAILDKSDFNRILKAKEERRLIEEMNFFSNMRIFSGWNFYAVKFLYVNSNQISLKRKEKVFKEGDEPDGMYVIKSGTFLLSQEIKMYDVYNSTEFSGTISQSKNKSLARAVVKRNIEISIMSANDHFGEESSINNCKRTYTVTCLSLEGILRKVDLKNFTNRVMKDENSKQRLERIAANKEDWLLKRIEEAKENILREKKYLNQMNFAYNFTEPDTGPKTSIFSGSIVNESGRLKLKVPLVKHNKFSDFDLKEQLNEESILRNGESISLGELKNKFQNSFIERMNNFEKGVSKLKTINSFRVKYFLERIPKPKVKKEDPLTKKLNQMLDDANLSKNTASLTNNSFLSKDNFQTDLLERFEKSQDDVILDDNYSSKKKLIKRLLASGKGGSSFHDSKKLMNTSVGGTNNLSISLSGLSEKPPNNVNRRDDITESGIAPMKKEFLTKIKESINKKYAKSSVSRSNIFSDDSAFLKKPEELKELVDRTFGGSTYAGSEKKMLLTKYGVNLPKIKSRKVYASAGM